MPPWRRQMPEDAARRHVYFVLPDFFSFLLSPHIFIAVSSRHIVNSDGGRRLSRHLSA